MNTTLVENKSASIGWLAGWAIASAVGLGLGIFLTLPVLWSLSETVNTLLPELLGAVIFGTLFGMSVGAFVGIAQSIVLRMRGQGGVRWVGASILGGMLGGMAALVLLNVFQVDESPLLNTIGFGLLGGLLGFVQYVLVRQVAKTALWIAASALGMIVSMLGLSGLADAPIWVFALCSLVYGLVTAVTLWWVGKAKG